ncbi:MAG: hypothetical protein GXY86_02405, partial [Firmicutes bacterium]|nr:hypothetical protein [Bacillota bacterium]
MSFNPINASKEIVEKYIRYINTSLFINDPVYMKQVQEILKNSNEIAKGPYLDVSDSFEKGLTVKHLVNEGILCSELLNIKSNKLPFDRPLYKHQEEAIRKIQKDKN